MPVSKKTTKESWLIGHVHSIESLGALDGPGLRSVVFFQGCPLRCKFCHNIDCAQSKGGTPYTDMDLVDELLKFKPYWGKKKGQGGVTFSGGEPFQQYQFVYSVAKKLHDLGVHVAMDSCLFTTTDCIDLLIPVVNIWMISIKELDSVRHKELTGKNNKRILENIHYLDDHLSNTDQKIRIRILIIPTMTDDIQYLEKLAQEIKTITHLESVELLAYTSQARYKWIELGETYALDGIRDATKKDLLRVAAIVKEHGLTVLY